MRSARVGHAVVWLADTLSRLGDSEKTTDGNEPARWDARAIRPGWTPLWDSEATVA